MKIIKMNSHNKLLQIVFLVYFFSTVIYSQANLIHSIDFDSQNRVIYSYVGNYDSSYIVRYQNGIKNIWNFTAMFNAPFFWVSSCVDNNDNIWVYMQGKIYRYNNTNWTEIPLPSNPNSYQKYSDIEAKGDYVFLTLYTSSIMGGASILRYNKVNNSWRTFDSTNSNIPSGLLTGKLFIKGDSVFVSTNKGLVLIRNESAEIILDMSNSSIQTQAFYSFYISKNGKKWLGTYDKGLVEWINNSTFKYYNQSNSSLPNNFINAIHEDSNGNLWLATDRGFARLKNDTIYSYSNLTNSSITDLKVDSQNRVWIGEVGTGRLLVFDGVNLSIITNVNENNNSNIPDNYTLHQNYPNPFGNAIHSFNPTTRIRFSIPENSFVKLSVYDILGREIRTILNDWKTAGDYEYEFDGSELPSG
ncbi:MAG: hypothetical protein NZM09_01200, partial [Ignavibacterium sp.]|nr:hypothetical protein [Ignavibacterium sp.]MDW8374288.1 two-component regulator propeller domain-containing protein [Ignavibacteriales bacterium]